MLKLVKFQVKLLRIIYICADCHVLLEVNFSIVSERVVDRHGRLLIDHEFVVVSLGVLIEFEILIHCRFCKLFTASSPGNKNYNDFKRELYGGN